jgi:hypothetical protein
VEIYLEEDWSCYCLLDCVIPHQKIPEVQRLLWRCTPLTSSEDLEIEIMDPEAVSCLSSAFTSIGG